jgi:hypothetical protein
VNAASERADSVTTQLIIPQPITPRGKSVASIKMKEMLAQFESKEQALQQVDEAEKRVAAEMAPLLALRRQLQQEKQAIEEGRQLTWTPSTMESTRVDSMSPSPEWKALRLGSMSPKSYKKARRLEMKNESQRRIRERKMAEEDASNSFRPAEVFCYLNG